MTKYIVFVILIFESGLVFANSNQTIDELFFNAMLNGSIIHVQNFINQGADVNMRMGSDRDTPLMIAVARQDKELLMLLISSGAEVNIKNDLGNTALYYASRYGLADIVNILIFSGAKVNSKNIENETALRIAKENGNTEVIQLLIQAGAK